MATLRVTHTEDIVLEGRQQGGTRTMRFDNITDIFQRVMKFTQGVNLVLYTTAAAASDLTAGSVLDDGSVKYVRVTSLGNEPIVLQILGEDDSSHETNFAYELQPGQSFYLYNHQLSARADSADDVSTAEMRASLMDIDQLKAYCPRGTGKVELFAASTDSK
tara:strand:+ start:69 stop:554 length:486 start_codon:yes stop_codon:yes gene_type:complete